MSLGEKSATEIEAMRVRAWQNRAKGKGVRWRMIRDTLATVSVYWMTLSEVETCMVRIWGLTRKKTRELLEEGVSIGDVDTKKDPLSHNLLYKLRQERVTFWMGKRGVEGIPAGIVEVVETTILVSKSEE
ncbi:unnamed protein product [marine sediment metagenome]|uniref:Uncharacterized protein n=1 Tax=marine sediment metagenome TaxID=412755 RepID=X1LW09_9ZZZZ